MGWRSPTSRRGSGSGRRTRPGSTANTGVRCRRPNSRSRRGDRRPRGQVSLPLSPARRFTSSPGRPAPRGGQDEI